MSKKVSFQDKVSKMVLFLETLNMVSFHKMMLKMVIVSALKRVSY